MKIEGKEREEGKGKKEGKGMKREGRDGFVS